MSQADIGLIGLAVMGQNLILNMNDHGFTVACFNRTASKVDELRERPRPRARRSSARTRSRSSSSALKRPRKVMLMVKAGKAVDDLIDAARCRSSSRATSSSTAATRTSRTRSAAPTLVEAKGLLFIGTGVSGGEEGARNGPSHHARRLARPRGRT